MALEDAGDDPQLEPQPGTTPLWPRVRVRALYERVVDTEAVCAELRVVSTVTNVQVREIAGRDWLAAAREDIEPIELGPLWIGPNWAAPPPDRVVVRLEPGLAFGSGRHPSTRLCLERLAAAPPVGLEVIDYGCGSGILAVAAAMLGARRVTALDIDPQALEATVENARSNCVSDRVGVVAADAATRTPEVEPASFVMANILAGTLIELAPMLSALTRPGGRLMLSGVLEAQAGDVAAAYRAEIDMQVGGERDGMGAPGRTASYGVRRHRDHRARHRLAAPSAPMPQGPVDVRESAVPALEDFRKASLSMIPVIY